MTTQNSIWLPSPALPVLREKEIHVWRGELAQSAATLHKFWLTLSADEQERARRFHFERDRQRFVAARGLLRDILGRYLRVTPQELSFVYEKYGKPVLAANPAQLQFNLSHSQDLALYAVTKAQPVGIDVEFIRPRLNVLELAESVFSKEEIAALHRLPAERQTAAFFNCWTRKEAFVKAQGVGLSHPLDSFTVSLAPGEPAALLDLADAPNDISCWSVVKLDPHSDYKAALAVRDSSPGLLCWQWF